MDASFIRSVVSSLVTGNQTENPFDQFDAESCFELADDLRRIAKFLEETGEAKEKC